MKRKDFTVKALQKPEKPALTTPGKFLQNTNSDRVSIGFFCRFPILANLSKKIWWFDQNIERDIIKNIFVLL